MIFTEIQYDFPLASVFLLLNLIFVILFWRLASYQSNAIHQYTKSQGPTSIKAPSFFLRGVKNVLICLAWIFSVIAFMQPKGNPTYIEAQENIEIKNDVKFQKNHQVTFLIDASQSMSVEDSYLRKSRLEYSKELVDEIINNLQGEMIALDQFSEQYISLSPPTLDYIFVRMMLQGIEIQESSGLGTDLNAALKQILESYSKEPKNLLKTLVILSDGGTENESENELKALQQQIEHYLSESSDMQLNIVTIGIGSKKGGEIPHFTYEGKKVHSSLQPELLQYIAQKGNGEYISADESPIFHLAKRVASKLNSKAKASKNVQASNVLSLNKQLHYDYYFQIPLALCLLCFCWILTLPESRDEK